MDFILIFLMNEESFQVDFLTKYSHYCVLCFLIFLIISYCLYSKVVLRILEKTKIPKLYKRTTHDSLWTGLIHLMTSILCFIQLSFLSNLFPSAKSSQPFFTNKILYAATANFCYPSTSTGNALNSNLSKGPFEMEWTSINAISLLEIYAVLIQEILLATRNQINYIFYSRLLGLIFVASAVRTRCPILSIQGTLLMSINSSTKEIARALVAWNSYSQEDSDGSRSRRPSLVMKALTFVFFLFHMVIWASLMLFYMPFFIHKLPSVSASDPNRLYLSYTYLSFLAYIVFEAATSPLWTTIGCVGWCRRSSGITWRILALSDCYLLGHYSPLVLQLCSIQAILDRRKAFFRNKMVQKHLASLEGRKRKSPSDPRPRRANQPPSLLATVKTVVALKKKMQRKMEQAPDPAHADSDSNVQTDLLDKAVEMTHLIVSDQEEDTVSKEGEEESLDMECA